MEDVKKTRIEHVKMKSTIYEIKNVLNGIHGRLDTAEENIRELGNKATENIYI